MALVAHVAAGGAPLRRAGARRLPRVGTRAVGGLTGTHLDNPVWAALTTHHRDFAEVVDGARRYAPDVAPFYAVEHLDADAWAALGRLAVSDGGVVLVRADMPPPPDGWTASGGQGLQMVAVELVPPELAPVPIRRLTGADVPAMLELIALALPGPFRTRTIELGDYYGVVENGRLVAMAGERLHLPGYTEISAVATHPDARRRGFGSLLTHHVAAAIAARGETPILHMAATNDQARRVYERLGFETRRALEFRFLRPSQDH